MIFSHLGFGTGNYESAIYWLQDIGFLDVIIPFALIFTVMFAVLEKVKVFSEKKFNAVIALSIALMTVVPHVLHLYPPEYDVITILMTALPEVSLVSIAIVLFLIMTGLLYAKEKKQFRVVQAIAPWIALALVLFIFSRAIFAYRMPYWLENLFSPQLATVIIMFVIAGLVVWLVVGSSTTRTSGQPRFRIIEDVPEGNEQPSGRTM